MLLVESFAESGALSVAHAQAVLLSRDYNKSRQPSLISRINVEIWFSDGLKLRQYTRVGTVPIFSIGLLGKVCL